MYIVIALIILAVLFISYSKIKDMFFKAKVDNLTKQDAGLAQDEAAKKARIEELKKIQVEATNMTPEEIENFWGKK